MPTRRRSPAALLAFAAAAATAVVTGGCHTGTSVSDGERASMYKVEGVSTDQVDVGPPTVVVHDGKMDLSGTVHRKPGVTGVLDGRVDIDLIGPDGLMLEKPLHAPLIPNAVPDDPRAPARYAPTEFGYVPPAGATLRARYLSRQEAIKEGLMDTANFNGNGGHTGNDVPRSQENGSSPTSPTGGGT